MYKNAGESGYQTCYNPGLYNIQIKLNILRKKFIIINKQKTKHIGNQNIQGF